MREPQQSLSARVDLRQSVGYIRDLSHLLGIRIRFCCVKLTAISTTLTTLITHNPYYDMFNLYIYIFFFLGKYHYKSIQFVNSVNQHKSRKGFCSQVERFSVWNINFLLLCYLLAHAIQTATWKYVLAISPSLVLLEGK